LTIIADGLPFFFGEPPSAEGVEVALKVFEGIYLN
jgi:hypothetical protein